MEKVLLPSALNSGCGYELFWHLNPHKLEPFFEARRQKAKEEATIQDNTSWLIGVYVRDAIAACFDKKSTYPSEPMGIRKQEEESMTDAERFRLFAIQHNKALAREKKLRGKKTEG